jgi:hypothetical protein
MPQSVIGNLRAILGIETGQFESGLKSAQGKLGGFGKGAALALGGVAVAAAAAATAISVAVRGQLTALDELGKMAQKVGVGVSALSQLQYAAELSDLSLEQLGGGLKKLGVNMAGVASGGAQPAAAAFKALGIDVTDANGQLRSSDAVFTDVAGAFGNMADGAVKTALAVQIFGKSGSDLIPLLNAGKDGLAEMRAEADALGLTIDETAARAAEGFNDNLTRLGKVTTGITRQLAAGLAPTLEVVSGALVSAAKDGDFMRAVVATLDIAIRGLVSTGVILGAVFKAVFDTVKGVVAATKLVVAGDFSGALQILNTKVLDMDALAARVGQVWAKTATRVSATGKRDSAAIVAPIVEGAAAAKKATKVIETEAEKAVRAALDLVAAEDKAFGERGMSGEQIRSKELLAAASTLVAAGFSYEAAQAIRLADQLRDLEGNQRKIVDLNPTLTNGIADLAAELEKLKDTRTPLEQIADAFYGISDALSGAARAFKAGDFVGVIGQAGQALKGIKAAFAAGATAATKFGAVAGVAQAAGQLIGGTGGAALSGAASGAAAGMTFGPVGAVVGGLIGGITGFFGASKAKKKAKKQAAEQAAAQARAEAERRAAEEAATKRELEIQLIEASGDALAAQAEREKDLLAALSPANAELQKQVWVQTKAADMARQRRELEEQLLEATGQSAEALVMIREDALKALPPELRALQQSIYDVVDASQAAEAAQAKYEAALAIAEGRRDDARDVLTEAYDREARAIEGVRDRFADLADALADFGRELASGVLTDLNPGQQLATARAAFDALVGKTDEASLAALPAAGRALLEASRAAAPNAAVAARDLAGVRAAVQAAEIAARGQVSIAQQQLTALQEQVAGYLTLNESVLSVRDAISDLASAMAAVAQAANDNAQAARAQVFDPVAVAAAIIAAGATAGPVTTPATDLAPDIAAALEPYLIQMVINTGATARTLDDVTQGGDAFQTVAA